MPPGVWTRSPGRLPPAPPARGHTESQKDDWVWAEAAGGGQGLWVQQAEAWLRGEGGATAAL